MNQLFATMLSYILYDVEIFFFSGDMVLDPNEIDIKDEPLFLSSNDNMVGYVWFMLNILYLIDVFSMMLIY